MKFMADTKIADSKRAFELQKSAFSEEVNIKVRSRRAPELGLRTQDLATSLCRANHTFATDSRGPAGL